MQQSKKVYLRLKNGKIFQGNSFGNYCDSDGEVVFTTGMTGYPESLTDPSYSGQILVFTYPLIGNYGIPKYYKNRVNKLQKNFESGKIQVRGVIISNYSFDYSHYDAEYSLHEWLDENKIPGIYGIDTRELTKILRTKGVMLGEITTQKPVAKFNVTDPNKTDLAAGVCVSEPVVYKPKGNKAKKKILLIDCGVKNNIIRNFINRGAEVICVPHDYNPMKSKYDFDGIFISNGPGDPKQCKDTIINIRHSFKLGVPIFGICLGSQILGLSSGADTFKLKFGHRSQNQPCVDVSGKPVYRSGTGIKKKGKSGSHEGRCYITSQNHGYAVKTNTLSKDWEEWFVNNNDGTNEGVKHKSKPWFAVQFHPESSPGPNDTGWLFDMFLDMM